MARGSPIELDFVLEEAELRRMDLRKSSMRKTMRMIGREIQKRARKWISLPGDSQAGEYPRRDSGQTRRAVKVKVFRSGMGVKVYQDKPQPFGKKKASMKNANFYYPAPLRYGAKGKKKNRQRWRLEPRGNYIEDAAKEYAGSAFSLIQGSLADAIKGVFEK